MNGRIRAASIIACLALGATLRAQEEEAQREAAAAAGVENVSTAELEAHLDALLPPLFPAPAPLGELMREVPGNVLHGLWDPRWLRLRLQPALALQSTPRRNQAELLLSDLRAMQRNEPTATVELTLRLAELDWDVGEVVASGKTTAEVLERTRAAGTSPRALGIALIARARWLRRVGSYVEAQQLLDQARSAVEALNENRAALLAALDEEVGATHLDRGDFEAAESTLARAIERRAAVNEVDRLPTLVRYAVARLALERDTFRATWETRGVKGAKPQGDAVGPSAALRDTLSEIAAITAGSERPMDALDRAWALSVLSTIAPDRWSEEAEKAMETVRTLISELHRDPAARLRSLHVTSWSPELDDEIQSEYRRISVERSLGAAVRPPVLVEAEGERDQAEILLRFGELNLSGQRLQFSADMTATQLGSDHLETTLAQAELAHHAWRSTGTLADVVPVLERAADRLSLELGARSVPAALALADLAAIRSELGSYPEAIDAALIARSILVTQLAPGSALLARTLPRVAWALREAGALAEVEPTLLAAPVDESLSICSALHMNGNLMLADVHAREGDLAGARELIRIEVARCREKGALRENLQPLAGILADGYDAQNEPRRAIGLDAFRAPGLRKTKNALVGTFTFLVFGFAGEDNDEDDDEKSLGESVWNALGGFVDGALKDRARLVPVVDPSGETEFYRVVGAVLRDAGLLREAAALERGAIVGMQQGPGLNHPKLAGLHSDLANIVWDSSGSSKGDAREEDEKEARESAQRSAEILNLFLNDSIAMLPERQALRLVSNRPRPESVLFSGLLYGKKDKEHWLKASWSWALRMRSLVLDELALRHQRAIDAEDPRTAAAWREFVDSRERLAALWVRGPSVGYTYWPELDAAIKERERAEQALAMASSGFAEVMSQGIAGPEFIAGALPERSALIEYVSVATREPAQRTASQRYVALTVSSTGLLGYADLGRADEIDALVGAWLSWLRETSPLQRGEPPAAAGESGEALRRKVWDPVVAKLGDVDLVFVVLDGALHQIQFAALPSPSGGYLVEHGPGVHILSTGRDLLRLREASTVQTSGMLALANPDFETASIEARIPSSKPAFRGQMPRCGGLDRIRWEPLPASQREVEDIAAMYRERGEVRIFTGAAASEQKLKAEAKGKRYLHLATHGFFLDGECPTPDYPARGIGRVVVESEDEVPIAAPPADPPVSAFTNPPRPAAQDRLPLVFGENPLLLSGLVLAGAHRGAGGTGDAEDGIVTAEELAALDLRGLAIASLSACDTGLGTVTAGEGVFGLRRALEIAGTRTVLMSLWQVPDESARRWMAEFYRHVFAGEPVQLASRAASRASLEALRAAGIADHPHLWAGFVAAGDWK